MELNRRLKQIMSLVSKYSEYTLPSITEFWSSRPNCPKSVDGISSQDILLQAVGNFNGESGVWNMDMVLDDNREISSIQLQFLGHSHFSKPYTDSVLLKLNGIEKMNNSRKNSLVEFVHHRTFNRNKVAIDYPYTEEKIEELSKPVIIERFSLSAAKNATTGRYDIISNEIVGAAGQACGISSESADLLEA